MKTIKIDKKKPIHAFVYAFFCLLVLWQLYDTFSRERELKLIYFLILGTLALFFFLMMIQQIFATETLIFEEKQVKIHKKIVMIPISQTFYWEQIEKYHVKTLANELKEIQLQIKGKKYLVTLISGVDKENTQQIVKNFLKV